MTNAQLVFWAVVFISWWHGYFVGRGAEIKKRESSIDGGRMEQQVDHVCANGHKWVVAMFDEAGGRFYFREDDALCPTCGSDGK